MQMENSTIKTVSTYLYQYPYNITMQKCLKRAFFLLANRGRLLSLQREVWFNENLIYSSVIVVIVTL